MRAPQMFSSLARLAAKAGIKMDKETGNPVDDDAEETDRDDEPPVEDAPAGDPPAGDPPAGDPPAEDEPAGDPPAGEDEEEDDADGEDDDAGTGEDAPAGETQAGGNAPKRSADFLAGQRHGAEQTAGRWAAVLSSPVARGNFEMATDLLATTNMSAAAIVRHCDKYKGSNAALNLLDKTPKTNLGVPGRSANADPAKEARAKATGKVNARVGAAGGGTRAAKKAAARADAAPAGARTVSTSAPIRRSRRAAAADAN
jgi:hypothetical protein